MEEDVLLYSYIICTLVVSKVLEIVEKYNS